MSTCQRVLLYGERRRKKVEREQILSADVGACSGNNARASLSKQASDLSRLRLRTRHAHYIFYWYNITAKRIHYCDRFYYTVLCVQNKARIILRDDKRRYIPPNAAPDQLEDGSDVKLQPRIRTADTVSALYDTMK